MEMNFCCENCGWSEIVGSPIICHYNGHRTWRDECCEAWKPKEEPDKNDMVQVVRCKNCIHYRYYGLSEETVSECRIDHCENPDADWFCADGEREEITKGADYEEEDDGRCE